VHKAIANVLTEILQIYTLSQRDKEVGPVIISNRWMDTMKLKAICGAGFKIFGVSNSHDSRGYWTLDASSDIQVSHDSLTRQTIEAFLCAIHSVVDIAPTDRMRVAQPA
jgi:hypothetical protein